MPSDSLSDFMANMDANGLTPPGGFSGYFPDVSSSSDSSDLDDPADFMRAMMGSMGNRFQGTYIDFDSPSYSKRPLSERAGEALLAYRDDVSDCLASACLDREWTKKASLANHKGERAQFMRAEKATGQKSLDAQKARIRTLYPDMAERFDKDTGRSTAWVGKPTTAGNVEMDQDHCWHCNIEKQSASPLKQCGGCRKARYCTVYCQKAAWKEHKTLCKTLANTQGKQ